MFPLSNLQKQLNRRSTNKQTAENSGRSIRRQRGLLGDIASDFQPQILGRVKTEGKGKKTSEPINDEPKRPTFHQKHTIVQATGNMIDNLEDVRPTMVRISTVSKKLIKQLACVEITSKNKCTSDRNGVNSRQMGIANNNEMCPRCTQFACPGHYGKITLNTMVINPIYGRQVIAVLQSICHHCGSLILSESAIEDIPEIAKSSGWARLKAISEKSVGRPCLQQQNRCVSRHQQTNPDIELTESKNKNYVIFSQDGHKNYYSASDIRAKFKRISQSDAQVLGFGPDSHPKDLIISILPVIPPIARPSVMAGSEIKSDQLTDKYSEIVAANASVNVSTAEPHLKGDILYDKITELMIKKKVERGSNDEYFSILRRLSKKDALIRRAIQGKRVDFSARGVLSPGSDLEFGEVGVPEIVARIFNMGVPVTQANYKYVVSLIKAGRVNSWTPSTGNRKGVKLSVTTGDKISPNIGDQIERWAEDGDVVVFNRQPSLHKYSFLGYTIKIIPDSVMRLHPSSTTPHNADFDGDTANQLYPRDAKSVAEVRQLMHAVYNMINEMQNKPSVGLVMDSVTAAYLVTRDEEGIDPLIFSDVVGKMKTTVDIVELQQRAARFGLHRYSGRTLFSALLPDDFYYKKAGVTIIDGILVAGRIKGTHVGATHRSIIQDIHKSYGPERAARFITDATWLLIAWLDTYGFSVGPADCEYGTTEESKKEKTKAMGVINAKIESMGKIPIEKIRAEHHEKQVQKEIDEIKILGKKMAKVEMSKNMLNLGRQNAIGIMVKDIGGGAKGDLFNVGQIGASVGQQYYNGGRPCPSLSKGKRCLPSQVCNDPKSRTEPSIEERGFCRSSFWEGMSVEEMFYLLWGGREGLINTSKSTAEVGTVQRDLSKALENIVYFEDGTIRSVNGSIFAFSFGGDGLASGHLLNVNTPSHGTIPSYCDTADIIAQANASVGWVREEVLEMISQNENLHSLIEQDMQRAVEIVEDPVPQSYDYGVPYRQRVSAIIKNPKETPIRFDEDLMDKLMMEDRSETPEECPVDEITNTPITISSDNRPVPRPVPKAGPNSNGPSKPVRTERVSRSRQQRQ